MKKNLIILFVLCFLVSGVFSITYIDDCQTLNVENETYILNASVIQDDSANCFGVTADNITLNCDGYWINRTAVSYRAIQINAEDITIQNCNLNGFAWLISLAGNCTGTVLHNNLFNSAGQNGVVLGLNTYSTNLNISNNIFKNMPNYGIYISNNGSSHSIFNNNTIIGSGNTGISVFIDNYNNTFSNNNICFSGTNDILDNSDLGNTWENIILDTIDGFSVTSTFTNTSACPPLASLETNIDPEEPQGVDNLRCFANYTINPNQNNPFVPITFSWTQDGVNYENETVNCANTSTSCYPSKIKWTKTSSGEIWNCTTSFNLSDYALGYVLTDGVEIEVSDIIMFSINETENPILEIVNDFNTSNFFYLLPIFAMGIIGIMSKKISTTALGSGILCLVIFVMLANTTFILIGVVLFLGGLGAKKFGF